MTDFKAEFDGFLDTGKQLVQRAGLRVATSQFGHAGYVVTFRISLDDDVEFAFHG